MTRYHLELIMSCREKILQDRIYIDGLVQDCSNSSALAMELLQPCTKQSIYASTKHKHHSLHMHRSYTIIPCLINNNLSAL